MSKQNKNGWIQHRGGKCPVEAGQSVTIRCRDGLILDFGRACNICWAHKSSTGDVMAYRINKPAEHGIYADDKDEYSEPVQVTYVDSDGPLQWRDRITEIDRTVEALEEERVSLVQRLEGEGFRLIERAVQQVEDMSDCKKVKVGDFVKFINESNDEFTKGRIYEVLAVDSSQAPYDVIDDEGDENCLSAHECEFHTRPSK